ncbi:MAG: hypothetical protein IVW52_14225 [Acidimicrobiales bacterium]|nr:hypothetical protein [Acidimicrobiales bacterium]
MMPVVLVIIIAVAWIVILGPNLLKRHGRAGDGISSISHFHHQLRVLEHSGPQPIVAPAYRLRGIDGSAMPAHQELARGVAPAPVLTVVGADQLPRPALAFLGADPVDAPADQPTEHRPLPDMRPTGVGTLGPAVRSMGMHAGMTDSRPRQLARRRRRDTLGVLATVFVATGMIGFIPGAGAAWMVTALSGAALVAYVALLVHLRRRAEERGSLLHHMEPVAGVAGSRGTATIHTYSVPSYRSGRYAHPSSQAAAAH